LLWWFIDQFFFDIPCSNSKSQYAEHFFLNLFLLHCFPLNLPRIFLHIACSISPDHTGISNCMIRQYWWKLLSLFLLMYTCIWVFLVLIPVLDGRLQQSVRNLFFHAPMWFAMMTLFTVSVINAIKYLGSQNSRHDIFAAEY